MNYVCGKLSLSCMYYYACVCRLFSFFLFSLFTAKNEAKWKSRKTRQNSKKMENQHKINSNSGWDLILLRVFYCLCTAITSQKYTNWVDQEKKLKTREYSHSNINCDYSYFAYVCNVPYRNSEPFLGTSWNGIGNEICPVNWNQAYSLFNDQSSMRRRRIEKLTNI